MTTCPSCESPLEGDETYCLQCGERIAPREAPESDFRTPALIVGVIALLAIGGVAFALHQVESDAERTAGRNVPTVSQADQLASDEKPTDVAAWSAGTSAYTVQLVTTTDEGNARARATAAVGTGIPAGVLETDEYPTLEPGRWILFTGRFYSREAAQREANRYAASGFPDATPVFISDRRKPGA